MTFTINDNILLVLAAVFFLIATKPPAKPNLQWQWLACACLVLTQIF